MHSIARRRALLVPVAAVLLSITAGSLRGSEELPVTSDDRAFFIELKRAVLAHDTAWLSQHVALPLHVKVEGEPLTIRTSDEFVKNVDRVITIEVVNAVRKQTAEYLFKNARGLMIGDGEIWFAREAADSETEPSKPSYQIIEIRPMPRAGKDAPGSSKAGG